MTIELNDDYQIHRDRYCWAIAKRRKRKGVETFEAFQWYPQLEQAVRGAVELGLSDLEVTGAREVDRALARLTQRLSATLGTQQSSQLEDAA